MPRTGTFQLARLFGIRIGVSTSWFFFLFFLIYVLSGPFQTVLGSSSKGFAVAVASALGYSASVVVHELGHALAARRVGIQISGIDLWFFGGIAKMSSDTRSAGEEFKVAVAGPLVTLLVIVASVVAAALVSGTARFFDVAVLNQGVRATPALVLLSWLANINALLLVFNLVPAFPLDGGRIARAIAWRVTGDRNRATRASARLGQGFAYLLIGLGLAGLLLTNDLAYLWLLVLGFFLNQAARGAVLQSTLTERIQEVTVADIMDREPVTIPGEMPLLQAQEEFFLRYRWPWFAVVDAGRRYLGPLHHERVEAELAAGRPALAAQEAVDADQADWSVPEDQPLTTLLSSEALRRLGAVAAVDGDGVLRGVVTLSQVRRALTPVAGLSR